MIDINKVTNVYRIQEDLLREIICIIDDFYKMMCKECIMSSISTMETNKLLAYITFLGESYNIITDNNKEDVRQILLIELKKRIENESICDLDIYNGLTAAAIAVKIMAINSGNYLRFSEQLDSYLLEKMSERVKLLKSVIFCRTDFYDLIMGISGWIPYLSIFCNIPEKEIIIKESLEYLSRFVGYKNLNNILLPKCYIENKYLLTSEDKKMFPNGYLNLGLSHGIAGILLAFSVAENYGITIPGHAEYISILINEFIKHEYIVEGITYWPGMININEYLKNNFPKIKQRNSWCYGNVGILCSLYHASNALKNLELRNDINQKIIELSKLNFDEHMFGSIIICHGLSGLLLFYDWYNNVTQSALLGSDIVKLLDIVVKSYKINGYTAFLDKDIKGTTRDTLSVIDGSLGCVLTLLTFIKKDLHFQKCLGFFV